MRNNYPISSQELKDEIDQIYEMQLRILSYSNTSGVSITGIYDIIEASGVNIFASGYESIQDLNPYLGKIDYINQNIIKNQDLI